jgi:membrane AbrB-like protein
VTGRWAIVLAVSCLVAFAGAAVGLPSPALFGGLIVGLVFALRTGWELTMPDPAARTAQGILGVSLGVLVQTSTLSAIATNALPIFGVMFATLAATVGAGLLMSRITGLDRPTASFGMIAGGASGIVAISRDLGADERLVAVMQYLRVLVIVILTPIVAGIIGGTSTAVQVPSTLGDGTLRGVITLVVCIVVGVRAAKLVHLPAGSLLGPLILAAALGLAEPGWIAPVPAVLLQLGYIVIGLSVGVRFTVASLRHAARILPTTLGLILALLLVSAGLGMLLVPLAGVEPLDAYLATTPGGLYAVLAAASTSDVDTTFVLSVQVLRVFVMLLAAPLLARWLAGRERTSPEPHPSQGE